MSTFTLTISTDNAAFDDGNLAAETARILTEAADRIREGSVAGFPGGVMRLLDYNGNRVGFATFDTSDED